MFVVDNIKMRQQGEDHGNKLEFQFNLRRLFISVLLSSTLVTGEYLETYCLIANFISCSWFREQKTLHTSTPQGFKIFFLQISRHIVKL